jgi:predicted nucleic acid-binding protein
VIVVDASALVDALVDDGKTGDIARAVLASDPHWAAPAYLLIEVVSAVRGKTIGGKIGLCRADEVVAELPNLVIDYVDPAKLISRIWQLRATVSAYDAAYAAAAELLGCALVTGDRRLVKSPGVRCEVVSLA